MTDRDTGPQTPIRSGLSAGDGADPELDPELDPEFDGEAHRAAMARLNASPLNSLPPAVWLLLALVLGVEGVLSAAQFGLIGGTHGIGWRIQAIERFAFSSAIQDWMWQNRVFPARHLLRYVSFNFVHASTLQALFAAVLLAALGKAVGERFGSVRFLLLALLAPSLSAVIFGLLTATQQLGWLFGALTMDFALVGAFTWLRWHEAETAEQRRRAFGLIALLLVARLALASLVNTGLDWIAEIAAFALGFALSATVLGPGSWTRLRARLRG